MSQTGQQYQEYVQRQMYECWLWRLARRSNDRDECNDLLGMWASSVMSGIVAEAWARKSKS